MTPRIAMSEPSASSKRSRSFLQSMAYYARLPVRPCFSSLFSTKLYTGKETRPDSFVTKEKTLSTSDLDAWSQVSAPDDSPIRDASSDPKCYLSQREVKIKQLQVIGNQGNWLKIADAKGTYKVFDASGGAAVSCIGHGQKSVLKAMHKAIDQGVMYAPSADFSTAPAQDLAKWLIESTDYKMGRVMGFFGSGTEGVEAGAIFSLQYHAIVKPNPEPTRTLFLARYNSYHGTTLAARDFGGHEARKQIFRPSLPQITRHLSPCYEYRGMKADETTEQYVARLAQEAEDMIQELGPKNVAGMFIEPIVGAAAGCVPAVQGYLQAMKNVCTRHGVLLIFDEVMCGMGRTGHVHAWQAENVVPDIQILGKGLAGGYAPISAMLISAELTKTFDASGTAFNHGHTFQNNTLSCAAGLAVQRYISDNNLLENITQKGTVLKKKLLEALATHHHVGDVRGKPGFIGIEFVKNKETKESFDAKHAIAWKLHEMGLTRKHGIYVYPGSGSSLDGKGDYMIIAPAFNITDKDVDTIVQRVLQLLTDFFDEFDATA